MIKYEIKGRIPLKSRIFLINGVGLSSQINLDEILTKDDEITIYLDQNRSQTDKEKNYHKTYESEFGFTIYDILYLIYSTYWKSVKDLYNDDKDVITTLTISRFEYNPETKSIYPSADS